MELQMISPGIASISLMSDIKELVRELWASNSEDRTEPVQELTIYLQKCYFVKDELNRDTTSEFGKFLPNMNLIQ